MDVGLAIMPSFLVVGLMLGIAHAFDADHLLAVSSLAARHDSRRATVRYAALWAMGHGGLLIAVSLAILWFGWTMPSALPAGAERMVGAVLITAGVSLAWTLLGRHKQPEAAAIPSSLRERVPFLVGMLHGLAGSAAMLALIPVSLHQPVAGVGYAMLFSAGVLAGMMGFGLIFDRVRLRLGQTLPVLQDSLHAIVAAGAVIMGLYWVLVI